MKFSYKKRDNSVLFASLEEKKLTNTSLNQNYIPLYNNFFSLNTTNFNHFNLNHELALFKVLNKDTENKYRCTVINQESKKKDKKVFFKYSPLLDPVKFLIGKYTGSMDLPTFNDAQQAQAQQAQAQQAQAQQAQAQQAQAQQAQVQVKREQQVAKLEDPNNSAYVDSFFTYLTSKMLNEYDFVHGIDFYGSYLTIKNDFLVNIYDDIEYIYDSPFFNEKINKLFTIDDTENKLAEMLEHVGTRTNKKKLVFLPDATEDSLNIITLSDIKDLTQLDELFKNDQSTLENSEKEIIFNNEKSKSKSKSKSKNSSGSSCSSRSSHTTAEEGDNEEDHQKEDMNARGSGTRGSGTRGSGTRGSGARGSGARGSGARGSGSRGSDASGSDRSGSDGSGSESGSEGSGSESGSEESENEELFAKINTFPVSLIAMECCEDTLDSLIMNETLTETEWGSIIIQILMILVTYQKKFHFTHNDLHTNNIMYTKTDLDFLYYQLDGKFYKVPTFGRLYKIIDFGRAIYKFRGKLMCSDSFHKKGDAATQYNFEPYFNDKKPRLEPNYSFDLCRLGCALFDFIMDEEDNEENVNDDINKIKSPIFKIIATWCKDDKGRNVMYKNTGEERYPDFKLYKMIARTVHNHVPSKVLDHSFFDQFITNKKKIKLKKCQTIMDIDAIPEFIGA